MSVLSLPRIVLKGTTEWNPATNNNALQFGYNKNPVSVALPDGVSYDDFDAWLIEFNGRTTNGDWNVFGQMQSWFNAKVNATRTVDSIADDPLIGASLRFSGGDPKLVDVNAYSSVTSQVFFDSIGVDAGNGISVSGPGSSRMYSRRPFFSRNAKRLPIAGGMGVVWQTTIEKEKIRWGSAAEESAVLNALRHALESPDAAGLMFRCSSYTTLYFTRFVEGGWIDQPTAVVYRKLADAYKDSAPINSGNVAGVFNPARSSMAGAIGIWSRDELKTVPSERVMKGAIPGVGPAQVYVNRSRTSVALDFQNTIPEISETNAKANLGKLSVTWQSKSGAVTIGTLEPSDYDQTAYENGGGIIDLQLSGDDVLADYPNGSFSISRQIELTSDPQESAAVPASSREAEIDSATRTSQTLLTEETFYADTDERGVYLEEARNGSIKVRVYQGGMAATTGCTLFAVSTNPSTVTINGKSWDSFQVGSDGLVDVPLEAVAAGNALIIFDAGIPGQTEINLPSSPSPTTGYSAVRVMPTDAHLKDKPATWDNVYTYVLRPFDLVYRGMSAGVFSLGEESLITQHANSIEGFTNPADFESPGYMPVTRDMSSGRHDMLVRFLHSPNNE